MPAGHFGFAVDGDVNGKDHWAMDDDRSGSCRVDLELLAGVGPTRFASSLAGSACGAEIMKSEAGRLGP